MNQCKYFSAIFLQHVQVYPFHVVFTLQYSSHGFKGPAKFLQESCIHLQNNLVLAKQANARKIVVLMCDSILESVNKFQHMPLSLILMAMVKHSMTGIIQVYQANTHVWVYFLIIIENIPLMLLLQLLKFLFSMHIIHF